MKRKTIFMIFGIIFLLGGVIALYTQSTGYKVINNSEMDIDEWSVCKKITNVGGPAIFIGTNTSAEWASFLANLPSGVTQDDCGECSSPLDCSTVYPDCGTLMDCVALFCCTDGEPLGDCPPAEC